MKKGAIFGLAAALAATAAAALLLGKRDDTAEPDSSAREAAPSAAPVDPDKTVAFPLKNKYADYSNGENSPVYRFELETPSGVKEVVVSAEQYETYYIGDEVVCLEKGRGYEIV